MEDLPSGVLASVEGPFVASEVECLIKLSGGRWFQVRVQYVIPGFLGHKISGFPFVSWWIQSVNEGPCLACLRYSMELENDFDSHSSCLGVNGAIGLLIVCNGVVDSWKKVTTLIFIVCQPQTCKGLFII